MSIFKPFEFNRNWDKVQDLSSLEKCASWFSSLHHKDVKFIETNFDKISATFFQVKDVVENETLTEQFFNRIFRNSDGKYCSSIEWANYIKSSKDPFVYRNLILKRYPKFKQQDIALETLSLLETHYHNNSLDSYFNYFALTDMQRLEVEKIFSYANQREWEIFSNKLQNFIHLSLLDLIGKGGKKWQNINFVKFIDWVDNYGQQYNVSIITDEILINFQKLNQFRNAFGHAVAKNKKVWFMKEEYLKSEQATIDYIIGVLLHFLYDINHIKEPK